MKQFIARIRAFFSHEIECTEKEYNAVYEKIQQICDELKATLSKADAVFSKDASRILGQIASLENRLRIKKDRE